MEPEVAVLDRSQRASNLIAVDYSGEITHTSAEYKKPDSQADYYRNRGEIIYK